MTRVKKKSSNVLKKEEFHNNNAQSSYRTILVEHYCYWLICDQNTFPISIIN